MLRPVMRLVRVRSAREQRCPLQQRGRALLRLIVPCWEWQFLTLWWLGWRALLEVSRNKKGPSGWTGLSAGGSAAGSWIGSPIIAAMHAHPHPDPSGRGRDDARDGGRSCA